MAKFTKLQASKTAVLCFLCNFISHEYAVVFILTTVALYHPTNNESTVLYAAWPCK